MSTVCDVCITLCTYLCWNLRSMSLVDICIFSALETTTVIQSMSVACWHVGYGGPCCVRPCLQGLVVVRQEAPLFLGLTLPGPSGAV